MTSVICLHFDISSNHPFVYVEIQDWEITFVVSRKFVLANGFTIIENDGLKQKNDLQNPNSAVCPIIEITSFSVKEHKTHVISISTNDVCLLK